MNNESEKITLLSTEGMLASHVENLCTLAERALAYHAPAIQEAPRATGYISFPIGMQELLALLHEIQRARDTMSAIRKNEIEKFLEPMKPVAQALKAAAAAAKKAQQAAPAKKRRGRPPGSKNKPKN